MSRPRMPRFDPEPAIRQARLAIAESTSNDRQIHPDDIRPRPLGEFLFTTSTFRRVEAATWRPDWCDDAADAIGVHPDQLWPGYTSQVAAWELSRHPELRKEAS